MSPEKHGLKADGTSEPGTADLSLGPLHLVLSGKLAYQALAICAFLGGAWWFQHQIMQELQSVKHEVLETKIEVQALIEVAPASQQRAIRESIEEKHRILNLAQGTEKFQ